MINYWNHHFDEEIARCVYNTIKKQYVSYGKLTLEFEQRMAALLNVKYCLATNTGTSALIIALLEANIQLGDEVIIPNRTWIATAHAAHLIGTKVVLVDVESNRPIIDIQEFEKAITSKTKAVIPVYLNGQSADMIEINRIAKKNNIVVIEDACQALFSKNKNGEYLGCHSRIGCFSLSSTKFLTGGDGGFVVTNDDIIAKNLNNIRMHGVGNEMVDTWGKQPGGNFRMTDLAASIILPQLDKYQETYNKFKKVYQRYYNGLKDIPDISLIQKEDYELPLYIECLSPKRDNLVRYLHTNGIIALPLYQNLNKASYFSSTGQFPNSDKYENEGMFLPGGPDIKEKEIDYVIDKIRLFMTDNVQIFKRSEKDKFQQLKNKILKK